MVKDLILVVDDEAEFRRGVARQVRAICHGFEVIELEDGAAALQALSPRVALLICDVNMPRVSGFEVCRSLRQAPEASGYREIPVILLTGLDSEEDVVKSWDSGSTLHLTKPLDVARLESAIAQVLGS